MATSDVFGPVILKAGMDELNDLNRCGVRHRRSLGSENRPMSRRMETSSWKIRSTSTAS